MQTIEAVAGGRIDDERLGRAVVLNPAVTLLQFTELTLLVFCCSVQPVEGDGQETATVLVVVSKMESSRATGVSAATTVPSARV